jgi:hypothetical protein
MDRERIAVTAESYGIRSRGFLRTAVQVIGIVAVLVGAYNYLLAPIVATGPVATVYREVAFGQLAVASPMLADIALMAAGAIVAWIV